MQEEVDDAIAELEGMRRAAEADEAATLRLRKRLVRLQGTLRKTRQTATAHLQHHVVSYAVSCSAPMVWKAAPVMKRYSCCVF